MKDLLNAVTDAQQHYNRNQTESILKSLIEQLAERIHYYGNIMDVLVQQHPEYVSLAWGAMKLLVGVHNPHSSSLR